MSALFADLLIAAAPIAALAAAILMGRNRAGSSSARRR
jgi:hypothetical protein